MLLQRARLLSRSAQLISGRALGTRHHQGEGCQHADPAAAGFADSGAADASGGWVPGHLYSLGAEVQELAYLHSMTAAQYSAAEGRRAAEREAAERATDRLHASEVPVEPLAAGHAHTAESAAGADEGLCEICCHDFYEGVDFERQLVLRSSWLCAGAGSLRDIRRRLEERAQMIADLESDGWQLEAPVDDREPHYACLQNPSPKPRAQPRVAEAWEIVESWERGDREPSAKD